MSSTADPLNIVMLNLFQHNTRRQLVIPKQVRDDELFLSEVAL